jgi:hypothetical protein
MPDSHHCALLNTNKKTTRSTRLEICNFYRLKHRGHYRIHPPPSPGSPCRRLLGITTSAWKPPEVKETDEGVGSKVTPLRHQNVVVACPGGVRFSPRNTWPRWGAKWSPCSLLQESYIATSPPAPRSYAVTGTHTEHRERLVASKLIAWLGL